MDTNANTVMQKEDISLSGLWLMNFMLCAAAQVQKVRDLLKESLSGCFEK